MKLDAIQARLIALTPIKEVRGAIEYAAALESGVKRVPACFVVREAETAEPTTTIGPVRQRVTIEFSVVWVVGSLADARGEAHQDQLETLREAGRAALLGWVPEPHATPIQYTGGRLLDYADSRVWWQDAYRTQIQITNLPN